MSLRHGCRAARLRPLIVAAVALALVAFVAVPAGAKSEPPTLKDPNATGRALAAEFMTILRRGDKAALAKFLDPSFQLQRADGTGVDKAGYVANPAVVGQYVLGDTVIGVQNGDVLTVRWSLKADVTVDGQQYGAGEAPRLSTFHWYKRGWRMSSHANFNRPA